MWLEAEAEADPTFNPPALRERPDLWSHLTFARTAFTVLSADRPLGALGGCGNIPWTAIDRYASRHGIVDPDAFERLERQIRAQDRVYMEDVAAKLKASGKK